MSQTKFSYNSLWKLLIDKRMTKKALMEKGHISKATLENMKCGKSVTLKTLAKICEVLECDIKDIVRIEKA